MNCNLSHAMECLIARHENVRFQPHCHCQHHRVIREKTVLLLHLERGLCQILQRAGSEPKSEVYERSLCAIMDFLTCQESKYGFVL